MMEFYKTIDGVMTPVESIEKNVWINMTDPTEEEVAYISASLGVESDFLKAALDEEETSRIEIEDGNQVLVIVDIPYALRQDDAVTYSTIPLGIIYTDENIITVCLKENSIISEFTHNKAKNVFTSMKARFTFQILYNISVRFLQYLKDIGKTSKDVERRLRKSMVNQELIRLLDIDKCLVYFSTSLKANEATIKKLSRGKVIKLYEEDEDLLEDVLIELNQAIEMCNIYSSIISGTMNAFSSVISNNLNMVMKYLASITIIMAVPTMIASFYGMNVRGIPMADSPHAFWIVVLLTIAATAASTIILIKNKML